jgi:hypothetical protein
MALFPPGPAGLQEFTTAFMRNHQKKTLIMGADVMTRYSGQDPDEQKRQVQPTSYPVCLAIINPELVWVRVTLTEMLTDFDFSDPRKYKRRPGTKVGHS